MTLADEFAKLKKNKTIIRRAIQENGASLSTTDNLEDYSTHIDNYSPIVVYDETTQDEYCRNSITQLVLNITTIRDYAFYNNTSLKELVLNVDKLIELKPHVFKHTHFENGDGIIYVPDSLYNTYMADTNWSKFTLKKVSEFVTNSEYLHPLESLDRYLTVGDVGNFTLAEIEKQ